MSETAYAVTGMTCEHCVASVTEEITELDGVTAVAVDLPAGAVTVHSSRPLDVMQVREAVEEAGYKLTGWPTPIHAVPDGCACYGGAWIWPEASQVGLPSLGAATPATVPG